MKLVSELMKKFGFIVILIFAVFIARADHLKGGWIKYEYLGAGSSANTSNYKVTVYQYIDCNSQGGQIDQQIFLGIFYGQSNIQYNQPVTIFLTSTERLELDPNSEDPCINPKVPVCYLIESYVATITLPDNEAGYTLSMQRCCRIDNIVNVFDSHSSGLTYTATIPGVLQGTSYKNNNSPQFDLNDAVLVCYNSPFTLDFHATDADNDSLYYFLCDGITGGSQLTPVPNPPSAPPYSSVQYNSGYSGADPMGIGNLSINTNTGLITGTAPATLGTYVVAVCVYEYRNGVYIAKTRKEIHVDVANCQLSGAELKPSYITCDGYSFTFKNESEDNSGLSYFWDFGIADSTTDTSTQATPTYTYPDTGIYTIKLHVANPQGCEDSTTSVISIFPGFIPDFSVSGSCVKNAYQFTDLTSTIYGFVNSWYWNFGDLSATADTSVIKNPSYLYPTSGTKNVTLTVSNSKGCIDTITKPVNVVDNPVITLSFTDTLICSIDTLQLQSSPSTPTATYSWQPNYNILNANTATPLVYPKDTTTYSVTIDDRGCVATDSVTVNVIDRVSVNIGPDTTICETDTIQFNPSTNALYFIWSPTTGLNDPTIKNPIATPPSNTQYNLVASVGNCNAIDVINVRPVPYPTSLASGDTTICYGRTTMLAGSIEGAYFTWTPTNSLLNSNTLTPVAGPQSTTAYILSVTDTIGCPKPKNDTVVVNVIPPVNAFAGNDTSIVANQPLQLNASGGVSYTWSPPIGINNPAIYNPVVTLGSGYDSITYHLKVATSENCVGYDDVTVHVFETKPDIFIPTAFSPNRDGLNDVLTPKVAGLRQFLYFRIYNRWGQMLFSTNEQGRGWDGTFAGEKQPSGTYVFIAEGIDYLGKSLQKKGTVVLIR